MTDGGSHYNNALVNDYCASKGIKRVVVAAYAAYVNGLVEGMNKIVLGRLKRLCCPGLGEDNYKDVKEKEIPGNWPKYWDDMIERLNLRILPGLLHTPKELMLGLVI
ncbi:hypothetical protein PLICRDRAFT_85967, partial [Plicaturopsis crispa FD-325 SS-3]